MVSLYLYIIYMLKSVYNIYIYDIFVYLFPPTNTYSNPIVLGICGFNWNSVLSIITSRIKATNQTVLSRSEHEEYILVHNLSSIHSQISQCG